MEVFLERHVSQCGATITSVEILGKTANGNNTRLVSLYILTPQSIFDIFHLAAEAHTHTHTSVKRGGYGPTTETAGTIPHHSQTRYHAPLLKRHRGPFQRGNINITYST